MRRHYQEGGGVVSDGEAALHEAQQLLRQDARAALQRARQVLESSNETNDGGGYQRWLLLKGAAQARLGDTEDGARLMREVRDWADEHADTALLAWSHRQLSALFRRVGDPALMLEHAVTAVNLLDEQSTPVEDAIRADHLLGLADALGASGSYEESITRYYEAAKLADGCGDAYLQTAALNNLAYTHYEAGSVTEAVTAAELLREKVALSGQPTRTHFADTIARAYAAASRYAEAVEIIEPFCAAAPDTGDDCDALVVALLTLAEVRRLAGEHAEAQSALDRSSSLAEKYALSGRVIETLREQAELHAARGAYREAFETHQAFYRADLELRAMERDSRARTLNAIFEATEARRSSDYFRELSGRDPLTGLHNRRHLDEELLRLLGLVETEGGALTIALIDLDHFKRVNDTLSHAVGDEVLRQVATLLKAAVEDVKSGLAARMGGEEFLLLLPGLTGDETADRLECLRATIVAHPWVAVTGGLPITASIGVASAPADADERGALLAHADENLYRAKHAGRNRVVASSTWRGVRRES